MSRGYFTLTSPILVLFLFGLIFIFRAFFAKNTGFWCDEVGWIGYSIGTYGDTIKNVINEPGPLGPLDLLLIAFFGKNLIFLGIDPHVALRIFTILLATGTSLLAFGSKFVTKPERWSWLLWSASNSAINAMATNMRPYAGMIFFSACALFAGVELIRSKSQAPTKFFWLLMALLFVSSLAHPYILMAMVFILPFIFLSTFSKRHKALLSGLLLIGIAVKVYWFAFLRSSPEHTLAFPHFFQQVMRFHWLHQLNEGLHALASPGTPLKVVGLFYLGGLFLALKEKLIWGIALAAMLLGGLVIRIFLNIRHEYFFASRQLLIALPFLGWLTTLSISYFFSKRWKLRWVIGAVFLVVGIILPLRHWVLNVPPFVDIPRYKMHETFNLPEFSDDKTIIVLSSCHVGSAYLYSSNDGFKNYFDHYAAKNKMMVPVNKRVLLWSTAGNSCSGEIAKVPNDLNLLKLTKNNPSQFAVLAPFNVAVPEAIRHLPCRTEINSQCN